MKVSLKIYYGLLLLILAAQAISTVYQLGGTIGHGEKLTQLQQEYQLKEKELALLKEKKHNLASLTISAMNESDLYQPIVNQLL